MDTSPRILHLADSHIGAGLPRRIRVRKPRRGDDLIDSYRRVIALALTEEVDLVIHAGDVFDTPAPTGSAMASAAEPLLDLAARGIPVVIVPGNHERSALPSSLFFAHERMHIADRPTVWTFCLRGRRVAVAAVPCIRRHAAQRFADAVEATGWRAGQADVNILVVHQTFESARCGPVGYRFRSGEDVVERDAVPPEFHYVAAGHVHRHQVLESTIAGGPPIVYAGSPDRVSFAERDEPKGCVLVELGPEGVTHRFIEHSVRPMRIVPLDVTGMDATAITSGIGAVLAALPAGVIATLRLSGRATSGQLKGLGLAGLVRELRPDALINVSTQAVEFEAATQATRAGRDASRPIRSAFDQLRAPPAAPQRVRVDDLTALPRTRGVYALYDGGRRLLYIGKAANLRARVQSHVRGTKAAGHFEGWTAQIAEVEARPAYSELEALLIEADLISRLRPPFNRHMRSWSRYCYIRVTGRPHAELAVSRQPAAGETCYGPYRGRHQAETIIAAVASAFGTAQCPEEHVRAAPLPLFESNGGERLCDRYFDGRCRGPCAGRIDPGEYARLLRQRHALLAGVDDAALVAWEGALPDPAGALVGGDGEDPHTVQRGRLTVLRAAFEHAATLRAAERLLNGWIVLPGAEGESIVAIPTGKGIYFLSRGEGRGDAERFLREYHGRVGSAGRSRETRLAKSIIDALSLAARHWRAADAAYTFVPQEDARSMSTDDVAGM